jgi:cardiolipin synthase C
MRRVLVALATGAWIALAASCARLPEVEPAPSFAFADTGGTTLGAEVGALAAGRPGQSGVHLLGNPRRAMATLMELADAAERSLDIQTYAWHADTVGWLMIDAVWRAAERGVRVRILLDDLNTAGKDWVIAALDAHESIEVRLFNPFTSRSLRFLDVARDFIGSNRRMHNKSFTADNQATVLGGRNIGDSYHGDGVRVTFADLDVLAVGPVVQEVSAQFDLFWNSRFAVPAAHLIRPQSPPPPDYLETRSGIRLSRDESVAYRDGLDGWRGGGPLAMQPLHWGSARLIFDPPEKIAVGRFAAADTMVPALLATMGVPERRLDIVTPYFVVSRAWSDVFVDWAGRGVQLRILTNSLAANDPGIAHAGYLVRRRGLLLGGVELFELKASATDPHLGDDLRGLASSFATLHAKAAAIDGRRLFVGSLNLDQRSAYLNTEMGIVIESPDLAWQLHRMFDERLDEHAYRVVIGADGRLAWIERTVEGEVVHDREPEAGLLRLLGVGIMVLLPVDWLL